MEHKHHSADDIRAVVSGLREFIRDEVMPRHARNEEILNDSRRMYDQGGRYRPEVLALIREVREASAAGGFYTMLVPTAMGGGGLGLEALYRAWEEVYHLCGSRHWLGYWALSHWARGPSKVLAGATTAWKSNELPLLMSGTRSMCFGMSEPDAGSDAWRMRTMATADGDSWVIDGMKQWVTNAPYADYCLTFAVTDRGAADRRKGGITAFMVPTGTPGFRIDSIIHMWGHSGGDEAIISYSGVRVGPEQVIGEVGRGFEIAMQGVSSGRLYNSARSVGMARWAFEMALEYASDRVTFGKPIIDNQAVSFKLADSSIEIQAARLLGLEVAREFDAGRGTVRHLAMAKALSTETAVRVLDRAMQVHGAMGFTNEVGLAEAFLQIRRLLMADGSSEILRRAIVKDLRAGDTGFLGG